MALPRQKARAILHVRPLLRGRGQLGDADAGRLLELGDQRRALGSGHSLSDALGCLCDRAPRIGDGDVPAALMQAHDLQRGREV